MELPAVGRMVKWLMRSGEVMFPTSRAAYTWASRTLEIGSVLDVGCCFGAGTMVLAERGFKTIGVDTELLAVMMARGLYPWADWETWDVSEHPFRVQFDHVLAMESLEHMDNQLTAMRNMLATAKQTLVITTPNAAVSAGTNPEHTHELTLSEIRDMVTECGDAEIEEVLENGSFEPVGDLLTCGDFYVVIRKVKA